MREKELKVLEPLKENVEQKPKEELKTFERAHITMQRTFEKANLPKSQQTPQQPMPKELPAAKQQQSQAKILEHRIQNTYSPKEQQRTHNEANRKTEERKQTRQEQERETVQTAVNHRLEKNKNDEREQQQEKAAR